MFASVTSCNKSAIFGLCLWRLYYEHMVIGLPECHSQCASATDAVTEYFLKCQRPFAMYSYPIFVAIIAIFNFFVIEQSWMEGRNVNFMTVLHRQADHFCPFGVMPVEDRVYSAKEKKTGLVRCYLSSGLWLWLYLCTSLCIAQSFFFLPPSYCLSVTVVNFSQIALHPHPSLHITVTLWHHITVPAVPRSHEDPRLDNSSSSLHSAQLTEWVFLALEEAFFSAVDELNSSSGEALCYLVLYLSHLDAYSSARLNSFHLQTLLPCQVPCWVLAAK